MITVQVPASFHFDTDDYHEFEGLQKILKKSLGLSYSFEGVGCNGRYHAIFWHGDKPVKFIESAKKTYNKV